MSQALGRNPDVLRKFCAKYPLRRIKKDRPLFYQGEIPQGVFFIKSGVVKIYNITTSGEEKIIGYEAEDSLLPTGWLFDRSTVSTYYYDTFTDCDLYSVSKSELLEFIGSDLSVANTLVSEYVSRFIGASMHIHALEQSRARDKLLHIFQYLVLRFGKPVTKTTFKIELRLTHQDIANLVGLTRETVTAEVNKLIKMGIAKSENHHYIVNSDKALRLLGESDFEKLDI